MSSTAPIEVNPPPLLCPSPNNVGFRSLRAKTLCVPFTLLVVVGGEKGRGVGGWTFKNVCGALFSHL